jgi:hypothetical protein
MVRPRAFQAGAWCRCHQGLAFDHAIKIVHFMVRHWDGNDELVNALFKTNRIFLSPSGISVSPAMTPGDPGNFRLVRSTSAQAAALSPGAQHRSAQGCPGALSWPHRFPVVYAGHCRGDAPSGGDGCLCAATSRPRPDTAERNERSQPSGVDAQCGLGHCPGATFG